MADIRLIAFAMTAAELASLNPQLAVGEFAYETDTERMKVGDGSLAYNSRPYYAAPTPVYDLSAATTLTILHGNSIMRHPASDANNRTFTIPANASVAYPIGTVLAFENEVNVVTIAITTDVLAFMDGGAGGTGSRSLAANGSATARKVTATRWLISGVGLT